ncbi:MAG: hypothetical protein NXI09_15665 [Bacteroidetes bacterium]|nr:hypothetical protein [Bacteroidota bacterium]
MDLLIGQEFESNKHGGRAYHLERGLLKARVLMQKEVFNRSEQHLGTLIRKALQNEDYEIALRAQRTSISLTALHRDDKKFAKQLKSIDELQYLNQQKFRAIRLYQELRIRKQRDLNENLDDYLLTSHRSLVELANKTNSKTIRFIQIFFEKELLEQKCDPAGALALIEPLQKLEDFALNQFLLGSNMELFFELGRLLFSIGQVHSSEFFLQKCIQNMSVVQHAYHKSLELLFFLYHHQGRIKDRDNLLYEKGCHLMKNDLLNAVERGHWLFYRACLSLEAEEYQKCLRDIDRIFAHNKPEMSLNLHLRMIRIIALIESQLLDHSDREIEALRKFISRNKLRLKLDSLGLTDCYHFMLSYKKQGYQISSANQVAPMKFEPSKLMFTLYNFGDWMNSLVKKPTIYFNFHISRRDMMLEKGTYAPIEHLKMIYTPKTRIDT